MTLHTHIRLCLSISLVNLIKHINTSTHTNTACGLSNNSAHRYNFQHLDPSTSRFQDTSVPTVPNHLLATKQPLTQPFCTSCHHQPTHSTTTTIKRIRLSCGDTDPAWRRPLLHTTGKEYKHTCENPFFSRFVLCGVT